MDGLFTTLPTKEKKMRSSIIKIMGAVGVLSLLAAAPLLADMGGGSSGGGSGMGTGGMSGPSSESMQRASGMMNVGDMPMVSTGSTSSGGVKLDLKPVSLEKGQLKIKFKANTHAENLARHNLMQQAMLIYGENEVGPVKVDRMGGHHAGGTMIFEVGGNPEHFKIVIKGIPGVEERIYEW